MNKPNLILIGGGHCKSCIDVIEQEQRFQIAEIIALPENKIFITFVLKNKQKE